MRVQTTAFIRGGTNPLKEKISAMREDGWFNSAILSDDRDFFVVFRNKYAHINYNMQKDVSLGTNLQELDSEIEKQEKLGWLVSTIAVADDELLVTFGKEVYTTCGSFSTDPLLIYQAHYGD